MTKIFELYQVIRYSQKISIGKIFQYFHILYFKNIAQQKLVLFLFYHLLS